MVQRSARFCTVDFNYKPDLDRLYLKDDTAFTVVLVLNVDVAIMILGNILLYEWV